MYKRDAGEMQACTATRTWQGLELPNELPPKPEEKKRAGDQGCMHNTKAQHSTALLLALAPRAGNAEREERDRNPDITPDELAPAGRHLIWATWCISRSYD